MIDNLLFEANIAWENQEFQTAIDITCEGVWNYSSKSKIQFPDFRLKENERFITPSYFIFLSRMITDRRVEGSTFLDVFLDIWKADPSPRWLTLLFSQDLHFHYEANKELGFLSDIDRLIRIFTKDLSDCKISTDCSFAPLISSPCLSIEKISQLDSYNLWHLKPQLINLYQNKDDFTRHEAISRLVERDPILFIRRILNALFLFLPINSSIVRWEVLSQRYPFIAKSVIGVFGSLEEIELEDLMRLARFDAGFDIQDPKSWYSSMSHFFQTKEVYHLTQFVRFPNSIP